jgi:hypothetical protein
VRLTASVDLSPAGLDAGPCHGSIFFFSRGARRATWGAGPLFHTPAKETPMPTAIQMQKHRSLDGREPHSAAHCLNFHGWLGA